jgi:hypothetical protein
MSIPRESLFHQPARSCFPSGLLPSCLIDRGGGGDRRETHHAEIAEGQSPNYHSSTWLKHGSTLCSQQVSELSCAFVVGFHL